MSKRKLSSKQLLLLMLYSPGVTEQVNEPIRGRTRIVKMMFLFEHEIKDKFMKASTIDEIEMPEFYPWDYGPFSRDVYDDIEFFINNGFVENRFLEDQAGRAEVDEFSAWVESYAFDDEKDDLSEHWNQEEFRLTELGRRYVEEKGLFEQLAANQKRILREFKSTINRASLEAILRYVYLKYPKYTEKSKIRGQIVG